MANSLDRLVQHIRARMQDSPTQWPDLQDHEGTQLRVNRTLVEIHGRDTTPSKYEEYVHPLRQAGFPIDQRLNHPDPELEMFYDNSGIRAAVIRSCLVEYITNILAA